MPNNNYNMCNQGVSTIVSLRTHALTRGTVSTLAGHHLCAILGASAGSGAGLGLATWEGFTVSVLSDLGSTSHICLPKGPLITTRMAAGLSESEDRIGE